MLLVLPCALVEPTDPSTTDPGMRKDSLHIVTALPYRATEPGVDVAFLGTRAGLLRQSLFVGSEKISDR